MVEFLKWLFGTTMFGALIGFLLIGGVFKLVGVP